MQLLASLVQELLARASLCGHHRDAPNVALVRVAEDLLLGADEMLRKRLAPAATEAELARRQAQLSTTFVGSLVPWLIDSLALFSAFAFEYAQRLLPLVLPLLNTLKAVLGAGALPSLEEGGARPSPELAQQTTLQSAHPYKPDVEQVRRGKERRSLAQATVHAEEGSWPGATQLQLRFDAQCCTHEGDWLTLTFFKEGQPVEGRTLRFGGPWSNWPKQPITVPADSFRAEFAFSPLTATTAWGYGVAVTASKRDKANLLAMPVLAQLRLSLAYLGTKCASLLVAAEPVVEEEKENRHWLKSPLFARGLPLQLPPTHSLMHPFFGIKPVQCEAATNTSAIRFLEDLTALGGGGATALHRHVVDTTREPQAKAEEETTHAANAARALLASLLSHNGLLHVAQRAAREVCGGKAPQPPPASPPPSPPSQEAMPQEELADLRRFLDPEADGAAERPASASLGPLDAPGMGEEELSSLEAFLETQRSGASDSARSSARQDGEAAAAAATAAAGAGAAGAVGVGAVWDAALHSKKLSREEWERLREQWRRARSLFSELAESHARTLTEEQKEADKGEGLARLMTFVLLVAKQNASQDERAAASDAAGEMQDLSGSMGSNVLKLFSNLTRRDAAPDAAAGAQGRALEEEIRVWVGSRVAPEPLIQSMKRQQCRAYSRAAGFRAVCELLRVVDDAPSLQSRLLSSLEAILQPSQATRSSHMRIADHYSRDCICAGPHANGRLSLAFAAMLEQLVHLLGPAAVDPAAPSEQQLRSLKCLLHIELRCEDLPVLEAVRLLPQLHELVQRVHTAIWGEAPHAAAAEQSRPSIPRVPSQESVGSSLREPGPDSLGAPSEGGLRHSQTVQLLFQVFVSRLFAIQPAAAAAAKHPFGLQRKLSVPGVDLSNTLRSPRGAPAGASTPSRWPSSLESAMVEALALDVQASASRMGGVASEEAATVIGAHTAGETWVVSERFLHSALSLLFQLVAVPRTGTAAAFAGRDKWLSALFDALHVGSLRCARLVLRILQHVLPNTSPAKLSASVYEGSFRLTGGGDGSPDFADFLLMVIGDALAGELSHADPVLTFSRSLWRNAQVSSALGSEAVALAQLLLQSDVWSKSIQAALHRALLDVPGVVAALVEEARGSSSLSAGDPLLPSAVRAVGAFCVTGGNLRSLYIGCHVTVMPEQSATRETGEHGILVKWDGAEDSEVSVLLDSQATDLRLLKCSVLRLLPMEEAPLPLASFTLSPDVMSSFEIFLPKRKSGDETTTQPTALQANFLFGLLQTRALKAFRGLLQHAPAMRRVLHSGLFPSIMASATTPVPLVGAHTTEGLQGHVALLENMHVEAASAARFAKGHAQAAHARRTLAKQVRLERASSMASDEESERSAKEPKTPGGPLRATISQLEGMGFEYTLCQKAIGMFGHDTAAAAAWLSEDRTRKEQAGQLIRSPSWQQADELAQRTQLFSIAACKKALEHTAAAAAHGTLAHLDAAAAWLAEHGAEAEADVEAEEAAADGAGAVASLGRRPTEGVGSDGVDTGRQSGASASSPRGSCNGADVSLSQRSSEEGVSRTVSFTPQAESSYRLLSPSTGSQEVLHADADSGEGNIADSWTLQDEFQSATPPEARPYSSELSEAALALARSAAQFSFKRARSRPHVLQQARPLEPAECLAGRLLRPAPLSANTNCVLEGVDRSADGSLRLYTRNAETDVLQIILRRMVSCQRAETSLTAYLPELEHLGANSSGLNAVSGAAHTMLAILLVRQSVLCLLSDIQCLKESDEDATSAFSLEQLGRPRELLDLLKLAYHSSGHSSVGGGSAGSIAFSRLWGMIEGLMRGGRDAALLPGPFKALPLLLRDDALGHLRREKNGIATLQSPHPLEGTRMQSKHRLFVDGASSLLLKLDRRSELNGTAHILFSTDEDGTELVGRWPSPGVPWKDVRVEGDTVWCHLKGEVQGGSRPRRPLWGFRVRACVAGWRSPEGETQVLETPLAFAWQLLELLSEHRPLELLTQHTYIRLVQYLHARCAPHLTSAASVLLRLLKLPAKTLCDLEGPDPRLSWPMQHITALALHVNQFFEAHPGRAMRVPLQIQLYAELVARAVSRGPEAGLKLPPSDWMQSMSELNSACRFMLRDEGADTISDLPNVWLRQLEASGLELMLLNEPWSLAKYTTLLRFATQKIGGPKGELIDLSPKSLPAPTEDDGPVMAQCDQATVQVRFALLQLFNRVLLPCFGVAWTGEPQLGHTLGAELCSLRQIIFTEVKSSVWGITMDAAIPFRRPAAIAANPPPTVTLNRRRALKERADRHAKTKHSVFVQLHNQLRAVERKELMRRERAFKVKFAGEAADDYGGPYREVFTVLASELENEAVLPLLQLSPNGKHNLGSNRDRFILNPGASSAESLQYFELVGMMFAFALMQKETVLTLSLCSVVWKQLVQEPLDTQDLAGFDESVMNSLEQIEHIDREGVDEDLFSDLIFEVFTTQLSHGIEVPICEGGADIDVTWSNRKHYCELVRKARLGESRQQAQAVLKGINSLLPSNLLPLFTHREIELMVCGAPDIDLSILRQHTRYGVTVDPDDSHIRIFWQVLSEFTAQQRTLFLSFIWSRTRLPATEEDWDDQCMKIHTLECTSPDLHLPVSHTCFFSMEWPRYSSVEIAKEKLLYAIVNCVDIDADNTAEGRSNMAMGRDDEL